MQKIQISWYMRKFGGGELVSEREREREWREAE